MCQVVTRHGDGSVTQRKLRFVLIGKTRRAMSTSEAARLFAARAERRAQRALQHQLQSLLSQQSSQVAKAAPDEPVMGSDQPCSTRIPGGSNHQQRISRSGYGGPEWTRKCKYHRACATDGDKSLRAYTRAKRRRTALRH
jgi:hypothetical protein